MGSVNFFKVSESTHPTPQKWIYRTENDNSKKNILYFLIYKMSADMCKAGHGCPQVTWTFTHRYFGAKIQDHCYDPRSLPYGLPHFPCLHPCCSRRRLL